MSEKSEKTCELTNEQAEQVAAGTDGNRVMTRMQCEACDWVQAWAGDYMNGIYYECPECGAPAYHGVGYGVY